MSDSPKQLGPDPCWDCISIQDLSVRAILGIFDHERDRRQEISIQLKLYTDISLAARSDEIEDALDYKKVTKMILAFVGQSNFFLIEKLAEEISHLVFAEFDVKALKLEIGKPEALRFAKNVSLTIYRTRPEKS